MHNRLVLQGFLIFIKPFSHILCDNVHLTRIDSKGINLASFDLGTSSGARLLRISGPLFHGDCGAFRGVLEKAVREHAATSLIVDLSELEFICSAGMSLLVQFERALNEDGRKMLTVGMQGTVLETVEMCGIDQLLTTRPNVDAALAEVRV